MKLVYGTTNPAKLHAMKHALQPIGIEVLGLSDFEVDLPFVAEDGKEPIDNARQKSQAYYDLLKIPIFSLDSGLYFIDEPNLKQPGTYIRRYMGYEMTDEELLNHYMQVAKSNGGRIKSQYINGVSLIVDDANRFDFQDESISYKPFYIVDKAHEGFEPGFPLNSLSVEIESGHYFNDIKGRSDDGLKRIEALQAFFIKHLKLND